MQFRVRRADIFRAPGAADLGSKPPSSPGKYSPGNPQKIISRERGGAVPTPGPVAPGPENVGTAHPNLRSTEAAGSPRGIK